MVYLSIDLSNLMGNIWFLIGFENVFSISWFEI